LPQQGAALSAFYASLTRDVTGPVRPLNKRDCPPRDLDEALRYEEEGDHLSAALFSYHQRKNYGVAAGAGAAGSAGAAGAAFFIT
jgi:hypothetical protein